MRVQDRGARVDGDGDGHRRTWDYHDEDGTFAYRAEERPDGEIAYSRPTKDGKWARITGDGLIPYRKPELAAADPAATVWVCRDEAEVDALFGHGLVATCAPRTSYWLDGDMAPHVAGRRVVVVGRADDFGRRQSEALAREIVGSAASVKIIEPPGLKPRMSVGRWLELGAEVGDLQAEAEIVEPFAPATDGDDGGTGYRAGAIGEDDDDDQDTEVIAPADGDGKPAHDPFVGLSDEDLGIVRLASVEERPVRWLWRYRLEMGGLALLAGDAGIGKSQVMLKCAAIVTVGGDWPDGSGRAPIGNVVIVAAEDRPDQTIKPRLRAMGADIDRVVIIKARYIIRKPGKEPQVHVASFQDRAYWREIFRRIEDVRLFLADPLPSYLGRGINDSKNTEIRQVLEPFLHEVIEPLDICMWGNTHLNKSVDSKTPLHRITGSIAYGALPRNVHFVVRDPDDDKRRFFKQAKCNDAPEDLAAIAFKIERREVVDSAGETIETAIPVFEPEPVAVNLGEIISGGKGARRGPEPKKASVVAEWLYDHLMAAKRPVPLGAILDAAGERGFVGKRLDNGKWSNPAAVYRAKDVIPELPEPRDGARIEELSMPAREGGRPTMHWYLCGVDAAF